MTYICKRTYGILKEMSPSPVLYLTQDEKKIFENLSEALREGWKIQDETINAYETDEQLAVRVSMADTDRWPELKKLMQEMKEGKEVNVTDIKSIPESAMPELLFTIGARGVTMLIYALMQKAKDDQDIEGLAAFSMLRHDLLETNASFE